MVQTFCMRAHGNQSCQRSLGMKEECKSYLEIIKYSYIFVLFLILR